VIAVWASFAIRIGDWWPFMLERAELLFLVALLISLPIFWLLGFYRSILRYAGHNVLYTIIKGSSLSLLLIIACWVLVQGAPVPRSAWFIYWLVLITLIGGSRLFLRDYLRNRSLMSSPPVKRVVIYGAGIAGIQLATALQHDYQLSPVAFVDDSRELQGNDVLGLKIYSPADLAGLIERKRIEAVLLAIPSASRQRRRDILEVLALLPVQVMVIPSLAEITSGERRIEDIREAGIEDLLGRDPIEPNIALLDACIRDRVVMVTGAGGSIGAELCRQIIQLKPRRLVLFELSEYGLYRIEQALKTLCVNLSHPPELISILGSVNHRNRIQAVMETFAVQTIYHTAAYKHVPIVERNPIEGVQNNILGTFYTAEAAIAAKVSTFVLISTDKAVRPTNVMGATKRFAELVLQSLAQQSHETCFCIVRFGNVLASSGSVVPLFCEQIAQGGPVTVTHPEMIRYFMTVTEAAQLVIQAGSMAENGDIFLLNMGEPVNITRLARRMIQLLGYTVCDEQNPHGHIEISFTGLRPGEKLYEELLINGSELPTAHPMIMRAREEFLPWHKILNFLERLNKASKDFNYHEIRSVLLEAVQGYQPECGIEDWIWVNKHDGSKSAA
jgi:FlaA1/EpsC-like NDP-sugar epimerase